MQQAKEGNWKFCIINSPLNAGFVRRQQPMSSSVDWNALEEDDAWIELQSAQ
jgi:hypothetical protein